MPETPWLSDKMVEDYLKKGVRTHRATFYGVIFRVMWMSVVTPYAVWTVFNTDGDPWWLVLIWAFLSILFTITLFGTAMEWEHAQYKLSMSKHTRLAWHESDQSIRDSMRTMVANKFAEHMAKRFEEEVTKHDGA